LNAAEIACHSTPQEAGLRVDKLPFDEIPEQSRLFLDYLRDPIALRRFYPEAVRNHFDLAARAERVLSVYGTDRRALASALKRLNSKWGASQKTLANIELLTESDCLAVVSGQQAGLFGGPLYTIYKALSAVKLSECLSQRGVKAVPVFWIATEDHDFQEVASAEFINRDCALGRVAVAAEMHEDNFPVGKVKLDQSIGATIEGLIHELPQTEFTDDLEKLLRQTYQPGGQYGDAFGQLLTRLTSEHGLILFDPLDLDLKKLAAPLYSLAASRAREIADALVSRSRELEEAGYHAQVCVSENSFPLFLHDNHGARHALTLNQDKYQTKANHDRYSAEELARLAETEPQRFSPNVTLRAVVQDYLLPTIAYYGGSAEIAYFAQTSEIYRILGRPVTPILHRASMTMVERHTWRTLDRYQIQLTDFFAGADHVISRVVAEHLGKETSAAFDHTTATFNSELDKLQDKLKHVDPTLVEALDKGRRKINYQLDGLRTRFQRAQLSRDEAVHRQLLRAFDLLYPEKTLQERRINITSLLARHGHYVVDWIFNAIDLGSNEHAIVYL
jgi:bacillithiol biosynthesis cysteine-adding enzyme BshC